MQTKNTQRFEFSHCLHALDGETDRDGEPPQSPGQLVTVSQHGLLKNVHHVCTGSGWLNGAD